MKKTYILALSVTFALLGCKESQEKTKEESIEIIENHTAEKVLDWDGTYKGVDLEVGVYIYMIRAVTKDNESILRKGNITLIR